MEPLGTDSSRRGFLKRAGLASASLIGTSKAWAGANDRVRLGLIGAGGRTRAMVHEIAGVKNVELVAVCDPDRNRVEARADDMQKLQGRRPKTEEDMRKVYDDKSIDAVAIANTNHWHSLSAIWACQAGKHVYVEKPVCHNIYEGQKMVEAVRKYKRVAQGGTQRRSWDGFLTASELLHQGVIGDVFMARTTLASYREPIGFKPAEPPPSWLNWDLWVGPAKQQQYHGNLVHYNWHWFWEFGNGEMGNNGSHYIDIARWFMGKKLPSRIQSAGGRFGVKDQGQTPNVLNTTFTFDDGKILECQVRNMYDPDPGGWHFYGTKGYMHFHEVLAKKAFDFDIYLGTSNKPEPMPVKKPSIDHMGIFVDAVRANNPEMVTCPIEEARLSANFCLLADIAYRLGRDVHFDPKTEQFADKEANAMLSREYRKPFIVPEKV